LLCLAIVSCGKKTADPAKSIDYMKIGNIMYADPACLDSVEVRVIVQGQLSCYEYCWLGIWGLSLGQGSQPVWCDHILYDRTSKLVFYPFVRSEGIYALKAGLFRDSWYDCVPDSAIDLQGPLTISVGASYWPKVITIEYDCQRNYNILSGNTLTQLNAAFNPCSTAVKIVKDDTTLVDEVIASYTDLVSYVVLHRNTTFYKMYLVAIADQSPRDTLIGLTAYAVTLVPSTGHFGDPFGVSVVFKRYTDSVFSYAPYSWDNATLNKVTDKIIIHELGHQRAGLSHTDSLLVHVSGAECVMKKGPAVYSDYSLARGWDRFCDSCNVRIKKVDW
jgi:hypothetical protein